MYDELVKRTRQVAEEVCEDYDVDPYDAEQRFFVIAEAADAIEELSRAQEQWIEQERKALLKSVQKWIPVTEKLPSEFVSVQAHMTDAGQFPSVREAYLACGKWFFPALNEYHPVDKWAEFSEPPKEET